MMRVLGANWTSPQISLAPAALECLDSRDGSEEGVLLGGVSRGGTFGWLARGPSLEVFACTTGVRTAAWCFGALLKDAHTCITCVQEIVIEGSAKLIVATTSPTTNTGLICLFDLQCSKIMKAIEVPYKVMSMEMVASVGANQGVNDLLSGHVSSFCGVLAVGTSMGYVYLLDLCLDVEDDTSDELQPNPVQFLDPRAHDITSLRYSAVSKHRHLCLELDDEAHDRGYYYYRKPDSSILKTYPADDVVVSSLLFIKQTGCLVVGFSFGCFQIWRLAIPVLEYSSRLDEELAPITHMAYQEPENDPRSYAYLWVARGPLPEESIEDYCSSISLFQLGFNRKVWHEAVGHVFEELTFVGPRFEHELSGDPYSSTNVHGVGSRIISCKTLRDPKYRVPNRGDEEDSFDEESAGEDLSLCAFIWEAGAADANTQSSYHLALFDMNRWYHAQMPVAIRQSAGSHELCSFFGFFAMDRLAEVCSPDSIMALHIDYKTMTRFTSCIVPPPEQHFYPSSLAFDVCCLGESGLVHSKFLGVQRQILADIQRRGPIGLLDPSDMHNLCQFGGLLPRNMDISSANLPLAQKRDALLSVALENDMTQFLMAVISQWSAKELQDVGCTLRSVLDWAWQKVGQIKDSIDALCVPLYDWSCVTLDMQTVKVLHRNQSMLTMLTTIFQALVAQAGPITEQAQADLEIKLNVVTLLSQHLQVILWFFTVGLLPEHAEEDSCDGQYGYPAKLLAEMFTKRRDEIDKLHCELSARDLLFIDGMTERMGDNLPTIWAKDGGTGSYPPPSLHALMNIYLFEGVPVHTKHLVVVYLLFDLMHLASDDHTEKFSSRVQAFAQAFCLTESQKRLIQGFWLLDHKEYEESLLFLLDPMVRSELEPWQNTRIVKAYLYQAKHKLALKFMRIRKPPATTPEDVKLKLTILLANGLTAEAFQYQQICRDELSAEDLLSHLFLGCQQTKTVDQLLQMPLSEEEERHLVEYLKTSRESNSSELLVMYYLQRSRFIEAIRLNNKLKHSIMVDSDAAARSRAAARNSIVDCYHNILPRVQRKLAFEIEQAPKRAILSRREVARPVPLSVTFNRTKRTQAVSQATLIRAVLEKVREVRHQPEEPAPSATSPTPSSAPGPFICTPITPRAKSRVSQVSEVVYPAAAKEPVDTSATKLLPMPTLTKSPHARQNLRNSVLSSSHLNKSSVSSKDVSMPSFLDSPSFANTSQKRYSLFANVEARSLLQTPPVRRKTPSKSRPNTSAPPTPQSILKMRHRPSANKAVSPSRELPKVPAAGFSLADLRLPTPPRLRPKLLQEETAALPGSPVRTVHMVEASLTGTPKQLRFDVPATSPTDSEASPAVTPDILDPEHHTPPASPLRSVRERSPTPERLSPKESEKIEVHDESDMEEDEEQVAVDDDITFTFNKSHLPEADDGMDTNDDTEPLPPAVTGDKIVASEKDTWASKVAHDEADIESGPLLTSNNRHEATVGAAAGTQDAVMVVDSSDEEENDEEEETQLLGEGTVAISTESEEEEDDDVGMGEEVEEEEGEQVENEEEKEVGESDDELVRKPAARLLREPGPVMSEDSNSLSMNDDNYVVVAEVISHKKSSPESQKTLQHIDLHESFTDIVESASSSRSQQSSSVCERTVTITQTEVKVTSTHSDMNVKSADEVEVRISEKYASEPMMNGADDVKSTIHEQLVSEKQQPEVAVPFKFSNPLEVPGMSGVALDTAGNKFGESSSELQLQIKLSNPISQRHSTSHLLVSETEHPQPPIMHEDDMAPEESQVDTAEPFKTPPRPSRLSVMPPTPPESGQGTPPPQPSPERPASPMPTASSSTMDEVVPEIPQREIRSTRSPGRSTRATTPPRSSRRSVAPSKSELHAVDASPGRRLRATTSPSRAMPHSSHDMVSHTEPSEHSEAEDTAPSTPSRSSRRLATRSKSIEASDDVIDDIPTTPTRGKTPSKQISTPLKSQSKSKKTPATPTRSSRRGKSKDVSDDEKMEEESEVPVTPKRTPTRRGRPKEQPIAEVEPPVTPTRTPTRRGKSKEDHVNEIEAPVTPRRTPTRRGRPKQDNAENEANEEAPTPTRTSTRRGRPKNVEEGHTEDEKTPAVRTPTRKRGQKKKTDVESEESVDRSTATVTPTRVRKSRSRKDTDAEVQLEAEAPTEIQEAAVSEGPLSSGSFMMNVRTRRSSLSRDVPAPQVPDSQQEASRPAYATRRNSLSRESTPQPLLVVDVHQSTRRTRRGSISREMTPQPNVADEATSAPLGDDFKFSDPVSITSSKASDAESAPPLSFVFSPPLTRRRQSQIMPNQVPLPSLNLPPSIIPAAEPAAASSTEPIVEESKTVIVSKSKGTKRRKKTKAETVESPTVLNLLPSPTPAEEDSMKKSSVVHVRPVRSSSMRLRSRRAPPKQRKLLHL